MIWILQQILCVLQNLVLSILAVIVMAFNAIILAVGTLIVAVIELGPDMPDAPSLPAPFSTALGWASWVFPVGEVLTILAFMLTCWLAWQGIAIVLRWAKAIES